MLATETLLNGNILSGKSCQFFVNHIPKRGFVAVNYKEKLEAEYVFDDSRDGTPAGFTSGRYSIESFTMTMLKARWLELLPILTLLGLGSYGAARFSFTAEYSEPLAPLFTAVDDLEFCRIVGVEDDYQEDIKALVVKLDLMALGMTRNGMTLWDLKRNIP